MRWTICLLASMLLGCGSSEPREPGQPGAAGDLRRAESGDTTGLAEGEPLLAGVETYRMENGALRVRGRFDVPDGTRIQLSIYDESTNQMLNRCQMTLVNRSFDSPPVIGPTGPIARGRYRFEFLALFNSSWQPDEVLAATDDGRRLRGPGVTRDQQGGAAFYLVERRTL